MPARFLLAACLMALTWIAAALAQLPPSGRVRGTIAAHEGSHLVVATREGGQVDLNLGSPLTVIAVESFDLARITPGMYVGVAGRPLPDGRIRALEVTVFPESARGAGEGQRAWDLEPGSNMTNAAISAVVEGTSGRELDLSYNGGSAKVEAPPGVPVVLLTPGDPADLRPGATVFLIPTRTPDGTLEATRITVSKNGVLPPM